MTEKRKQKMSSLITMSAITGKPNTEKIHSYLKDLKENGIDEFLLYPRSGCEIEYLSNEWFDTVEKFVNSALILNMKMWLYDDFNWPSGDAGGKVTANEKYRLKSIGLIGEKKGQITCKSVHNSGLFGEKYFPDLFSKEAVDYFIKCTHEEYFKRFGKYFGTVIVGMFTDEPSIGYCCQTDSIPYYEGIENDYNAAFARDFNKDIQNEYKDLYLNAIELASIRFNRCYISNLASWCKSHGLLMTGHLMCDNDPVGATKNSGHFLKNLSAFLLPGIDEITSNFEDMCEMALFGACEYASNKNGAMAELFALGPCDLTFAKRKCMLYLASAFKIDRYFLAISHMDLRGNRLITDYFNDFSIDQPDFEGMKLLSREAEKSSELAKKDFTPDIYIRYPFKQCANVIKRKGWGQEFFDVINELTYKGIQWKFIDDEKIEDATPVIEVDCDFNMTLNSKRFDISLINTSVTIQTLDGKNARGIFVRKYNDQSTLILNLFAPGGEYLIDGKKVFLDTHSVILDEYEKPKKIEEIKPIFEVHYCNENIIRTMHINEEKNFEIFAKCDTDVAICVRNGETASLNDIPIRCGNEAKILSKGIKDLYKMSNPITLKAGKHTIAASNDIKYLPTVFICGDFSYEAENDKICKITLERRKSRYKPGEKLYSYGKIELVTNIKIPKGVKKVQLQGACFYTKLYIDDVMVDEKITAPYEFDIDSSVWNKKINLKIEQYSSIGPIFGNIDYWDKTAEKVGWRGTPSPTPKTFGFESIYFLF